MKYTALILLCLTCAAYAAPETDALLSAVTVTPPASLHEAVAQGNAARLKELVSLKDADLNARDEQGKTALPLATEMGQSECADILLSAGADPAAVDQEGKPASETVLNPRKYYRAAELNRAADREDSYRHRRISACLDIKKQMELYKNTGYDPYENALGIYCKEGESVHISINGMPSGELNLIVKSFADNEDGDEWPLRVGSNTVTSQKDGLLYLSYRKPSPNAAAPDIDVTITGGTINGIMTEADNAETWQKLLAAAKGPWLDMLGKRTHLVLPTDSLREHCPAKGVQLLALYDRIIELQQQLCGWDKYGHPGNRILGRVVYNGYMFADEKGAGFHVGNMPSLCNPDALTGDPCWGVAHEFGHVNQTEPGMMWKGLTEVSNNLYSLWCQLCLGAEHIRTEHEECEGYGEAGRVIGGHYDICINTALIKGEPWQFQNIGATPHPYVSGDVFATLIPFWQLQLYCACARGNGDFYPDIFESVRRTDEKAMTNGELRMLFLQRACDSAKLDLTRFFLQSGMLAPMSRGVFDYGDGWLSVTPDMLRATVDAIKAKHYPEPDSSVLNYITVNTLPQYRDRLAVEEPAEGAPVPELRDGKLEVPAGLWKNAVAFEAYGTDAKGNETLLRVSLRGLNHADNDATTVYCPAGTTHIKAVQWDGTRYPVTVIEQ
ncbi:MAG: M60 family metallopeptidase [Akkermansia sp.]|nr:M60 family metallopeptidase [Akkermansia sp.]